MARVLFSTRVVLGSGAAGDPLRVAPAQVHVDGDQIVDVVESDAPPAHVDDDFGDHLIAPAFINAHTHLSMSVLRGIEAVTAMEGNVVEDLYFKVEGFQTPDDVRAFTRMGAWESLLAGVGCAWDHYYHAGAVAEGLRDVGLCGVVAPTLQDLDGPGVDFAEAQLEAAVAIDEDASLAAAGVVAALGPHATDTVSEALWNRCCDLAEARDLWMHVHVGQSFDEHQRAIERHGCSPVEHLRRIGVLDRAGAGLLMVHMMFVSRGDLESLDPDRHVLCYCPNSQMQFGFPAHVLAWHRRGLRFTLGTDCGACNDSMSVQGELRVLAGGSAFATTHSTAYEDAFLGDPSLDHARAVQDHRVRTFDTAEPLKLPEFLLQRIWSTPGDLHTRLKIGRIAAGWRANLAVWNLDDPALWPANVPLRALAMGDTTAALYAMMTSGQWRGTPGDVRRSLLTSDAYREARGEADARVKALLRRAGLT